MNHTRAAILLFAFILAVVIFIEAVKSNGATDRPLLVDKPEPITPAAAPIETQDSRLYALCPTVLPWQAPKYVKEHRA